MRLIIAGGRDYVPTVGDVQFLDSLPLPDVVLCGGATGADEFGKDWAQVRRISVEMHPADWKQWGRKAGPMRNAEMAGMADALVLFPGGAGTNSMFLCAKREGLKIYDRRVVQ